jgi:hypothetical protein
VTISSSDFSVLIIGAGMSGLLAAIRLKQAGIPYIIVDKNSEVGGTWYENTYPGCRVDNPNHLYCYSFEPIYDWPQHYSTQDALHAYFRRVAEKYGIRKARCVSTPKSSNPSMTNARRLVDARLRDKGRARRERSNQRHHHAPSVSSIARSYPDVKGVDSFKGPSFHSAQLGPFGRSQRQARGRRSARAPAPSSSCRRSRATSARCSCFSARRPGSDPRPIITSASAKGRNGCSSMCPLRAMVSLLAVLDADRRHLSDGAGRSRTGTVPQRCGQRRQRHAARAAHRISQERKPGDDPVLAEMRARLSLRRQAQRARQWRVDRSAEGAQCRSRHRSHREITPTAS